MYFYSFLCLKYPWKNLLIHLTIWQQKQFFKGENEKFYCFFIKYTILSHRRRNGSFNRRLCSLYGVRGDDFQQGGAASTFTKYTAFFEKWRGVRGREEKLFLRRKDFFSAKMLHRWWKHRKVLDNWGCLCYIISYNNINRTVSNGPGTLIPARDRKAVKGFLLRHRGVSEVVFFFAWKGALRPADRAGGRAASMVYPRCFRNRRQKKFCGSLKNTGNFLRG